MGKNILVAHGGGPTAVINCSLQGVVEAARESGKVDKIYAALRFPNFRTATKKAFYE